MPRNRRGYRRPPSYRWAGFYMGTQATKPTDVLNDQFTLFNPGDFGDDVRTKAVLTRIRGRFSCHNESTSLSTIGAVIQIQETNEAEAIVSESDPLSGNVEWIERTTALWNEQIYLPGTPVDSAPQLVTFPIDVKAKRRVMNPYTVQMTIRVGDATRIRYHFWARALLRIGVR